ncbi:sensor histidine kinase [Allostreptomyces psammosilenae]|uniref:histidine kinase n=1 Tax=Allostreptomyces psammosilenae TaxID=1892865 RepID=A0A853A406_9ACTN|nr:DUF4229 domain-containing protein [Allostreptomyces psammosilenae]NYI05218.1 signal transduction histidine kinase [Allostreptomyces psammosilenae]
MESSPGHHPAAPGTDPRPATGTGTTPGPGAAPGPGITPGPGPGAGRSVAERARWWPAAVRLALWAEPARPAPPPPPMPRWRLRVGRPLGVTAVLIGTGTATGQLTGMIEVSTVPLAWALGVLQVLPLLLVERRPLTAWRISLVGMVLSLWAAQTSNWPWPFASCVAYPLLLALSARAHDRRVADGMGAVSVLALVVPAMLVTAMPLAVAVLLALVVVAALSYGSGQRSRREAERHLAEAEERRRRDLARQAVLEERARIARELHDVVAHHMSMIAIQAEAAPYREPGLPERTLRSLEAIREASTTALTEIRRVVGLLREGDADDPVELAPQPGLAEVPRMVDAARDAGMAVDLTMLGGGGGGGGESGEPLPIAVDVSAYRIVQEALSNAGRHAPGARVRIEVTRSAESVRIRVTDDGAGEATRDADSPGPSGGGHGLVGMRERATMLGGTLKAGPTGQGGFEILAELPLRSPETPPAREG